jgi:transposase
MLRNECYECGQLPEWMGEPLCLILDHINGVNNDNRFENLRLLCPNCDAQQATFTGNNWRHPNKPDAEELRRRASEAPLRDLASCYGVQIGTVSKWLKEYGIEKPPRGHWSRKGIASNRSREARKRQRKVEPPTADELAKLLWEIPSSKIAERYGLSDTMICKWAKSFGLSKPPRGYWSGRKG